MRQPSALAGSLAVVDHVIEVDHMSRSQAEAVLGLSGDLVEDEEVVGEGDRAPVEEGVVVRAEAEEVAWFVGAVVRLAEGADVSAFGVRAGEDLEANSADLAVVVVEVFDLLGEGGVADHSHRGDLAAARDGGAAVQGSFNGGINRQSYCGEQR